MDNCESICLYLRQKGSNTNKMDDFETSCLWAEEEGWESYLLTSA